MDSIHRSENLVIAATPGTTAVTIEIRFPTALVRGTLDATCPRCGARGIPEQWEIEGPESPHNPVWLRCDSDECEARETRWTRRAAFEDDWQEID